MGDRGASKNMELKKINRRAQMFTVMIILMLFLVFISFELYSFIHEKNVVKTRVSTMNNFLFSIEENLERQMYISGFRILFLAETEIATKGTYINVDDFFNEAFFNGTVNGVSSDVLVGATYDDLIDSVNQKAAKLNVNITLTNSVINISQEEPWHIKFNLISNFSMIDKADLVKWEKQQIVSADIPVEGFEDPIYTVNTVARISRKINPTIYEGNYVNGGDVTNLLTHVNNNYYSAHTGAPSFLKRLEGNLSADLNGIESFVNIPELSAQGLITSTKSDMDYIYFSSNDPPFNQVTGMPAWFRIDNENNHHDKYGVTGILI